MVSEHECTRHQPGSPTCCRRCGCRCEACLGASRAAKKRSRNGISGLVDVGPARRRILALAAAGWTDGAIAATAPAAALCTKNCRRAGLKRFGFMEDCFEEEV